MASDHVIEVPSGDTRVYRYLGESKSKSKSKRQAAGEGANPPTTTTSPLLNHFNAADCSPCEPLNQSFRTN